MPEDRYMNLASQFLGGPATVPMGGQVGQAPPTVPRRRRPQPGANASQSPGLVPPEVWQTMDRQARTNWARQQVQRMMMSRQRGARPVGMPVE